VEYCEHADEKTSGFLNAKKFFTCWATVSFSRDLVCVTEWQVDRLIGSFFLVVVKSEHARFKTYFGSVQVFWKVTVR
jgi:hypothetical protein